jgi:sugar (Glycoside-Pentoside-Hexuronide) transporter
MSDYEPQTYTKSERNYYLASMFGQNILYNVVGASVTYYLGSVLFIPAAVYGFILTFGRIFDALNDPIMGTIVDRTRTKWGKCRPYLMIAPVMIFFVVLMNFWNIGIYDASLGLRGKNFGIVAWAFAAYILYDVAYTIGDIPLWSVTALMTEDEKDRTKLMALARVFGGIGSAIPLLAMQTLGELFTKSIGAINGWFVAALIFTFMGTVLFQFVGFKVRERVPQSERAQAAGQNFKILFKNKPYLMVLLSGILASPANLVMLVYPNIVFFFFANGEPLKILLFTAYLGGGIMLGQFVSMMLVPMFLKKFTKKRLYLYSKILGTIPFILIIAMFYIFGTNLISAVPLVILFILLVVCGLSLGAPSVLTASMTADCVDLSEYDTGYRAEGIFFSGQTFNAKLSSGIGTILCSALFAIVGFSDKNVKFVRDFIEAGGVARDNPDFKPYILAMMFSISLIPAVGNLLSAIPMFFYDLTDDKLKDIMQELKTRREGARK